MASIAADVDPPTHFKRANGYHRSVVTLVLALDRMNLSLIKRKGDPVRAALEVFRVSQSVSRSAT